MTHVEFAASVKSCQVWSVCCDAVLMQFSLNILILHYLIWVLIFAVCLSSFWWPRLLGYCWMFLFCKNVSRWGILARGELEIIYLPRYFYDWQSSDRFCMNSSLSFYWKYLFSCVFICIFAITWRFSLFKLSFGLQLTMTA